MTKLYDVVIAGAGPVGLFLAGELALAGASVVVLEREMDPSPQRKGHPLGLRGLNTASVESFYRRGLLGQAIDKSKRGGWQQKPAKPTTTTMTTTPPPGGGAGQPPPQPRWGGHFAGIMLDGNKMDLGRWKYRLEGPSLSPCPTLLSTVEKALADRAESLGASILRGKGVTGIAAQDDHSVTVTAGGGEEDDANRDATMFRGRWLVGCDGGRSVIRNAVGFEFEGTEPEWTGYAVHCSFEDGEGDHKVLPGFNITPRGMYAARPPDCVYMFDYDGCAFDRSKEATREHVQGVLRHVSGFNDVSITALHQPPAVFNDRARQATEYRRGRVLLAGDAAHIHAPLGGQGLNLGIGDAMNLGWKLAATVRLEAAAAAEAGGEEAAAAGAVDLSLLDSYPRERQPIGSWVLSWVRAQSATLQPGPVGAGLQVLMRDVAATTDGANMLIDRVWGLSQRYDLGEGTHALVGSSAPDFELRDGTRLGAKMEGGKGLLIDFDGSEALRTLVQGTKYEGRVEYLSTKAEDQRGLRALLVRPDGIVAWVVDGEDEPDIDAAKAALEQWFAF